ncbi:hypothetical protein [Cellulosimicrobium sp. CUA-896]|uniref:hypothetical protein n=1 Tax=Cellulosimicrobium sp. CUA-896 TaxID=1517881 RepID=UPI00096724E1|nr:hypothetical protein [Cellulosimicrobium sp. CUA-896]OLT54536.1 hypothetical protein BJF88_08360 [Cellulosimicrobium sp. CUA-896]
MTTWTRRAVTGLVVAAWCGVAGGCASPTESPAPAEPTGTVADTWRAPLPGVLSEPPAAVVRGEQPDELVVVTWGSGSCPALPVEVFWSTTAMLPPTPASLRIDVSPDVWGDVPCTEDYGPSASTVTVSNLPDDAFSVTVAPASTASDAGQRRTVTLTVSAADS